MILDSEAKKRAFSAFAPLAQDKGKLGGKLIHPNWEGWLLVSVRQTTHFNSLQFKQRVLRLNGNVVISQVVGVSTCKAICLVSLYLQTCFYSF
jgi:hypothetical protein